MSGGPITTHVLDTARGAPAAGVPVELRYRGAKVGGGVTDAQGRLADLLPEGPVEPGVYELVLDVAAYARAIGGKSFYPIITVAFTVEKPDDHFHVPLLLSPYGYTTYRGSR